MGVVDVVVVVFVVTMGKQIQLSGLPWAWSLTKVRKTRRNKKWKEFRRCMGGKL